MKKATMAKVCRAVAVMVWVAWGIAMYGGDVRMALTLASAAMVCHNRALILDLEEHNR